MTDIAGVRIITFYTDDVDRVAELVEKEFQVDRENSIDKGKSLEPNRFWAEIEHDLGYKNEIIIPKDIRRNFHDLLDF